MTGAACDGVEDVAGEVGGKTMTDEDMKLKVLVNTMRGLGDPLSGTSLYQQAATVIESLSRDLAAAKERIAELEAERNKLQAQVAVLDGGFA